MARTQSEWNFLGCYENHRVTVALTFSSNPNPWFSGFLEGLNKWKSHDNEFGL
jgi:hypothetical protein